MQSPYEQKWRQEYDAEIKVKPAKGIQDHEFKLEPDFVTPTHD
jgi:hypothetical protein